MFVKCIDERGGSQVTKKGRGRKKGIFFCVPPFFETLNSPLKPLLKWLACATFVVAVHVNLLAFVWQCSPPPVTLNPPLYATDI